MEPKVSKVPKIQRIRNRRKIIMPGSWDGKSRPSNEKYRRNFDEIFKKEKELTDLSMKQSLRAKAERKEKEENEKNKDKD